MATIVLNSGRGDYGRELGGKAWLQHQLSLRNISGKYHVVEDIQKRFAKALEDDEVTVRQASDCAKQKQLPLGLKDELMTLTVTTHLNDEDAELIHQFTSVKLPSRKYEAVGLIIARMDFALKQDKMFLLKKQAPWRKAEVSASTLTFSDVPEVREFDRSSTVVHDSLIALQNARKEAMEKGQYKLFEEMSTTIKHFREMVEATNDFDFMSKPVEALELPAESFAIQHPCKRCRDALEVAASCKRCRHH